MNPPERQCIHLLGRKFVQCRPPIATDVRGLYLQSATTDVLPQGSKPAPNAGQSKPAGRRARVCRSCVCTGVDRLSLPARDIRARQHIAELVVFVLHFAHDKLLDGVPLIWSVYCTVLESNRRDDFEERVDRCTHVSLNARKTFRDRSSNVIMVLMVLGSELSRLHTVSLFSFYGCYCPLHKSKLWLMDGPLWQT